MWRVKKKGRCLINLDLSLLSRITNRNSIGMGSFLADTSFLQLSSIAIHSSSIEQILKDIPVWLWSPDWVLSLSPTSGEMQLSYCWNKASGSWYSTSASGRWIWSSSDSSLGWYLILPIIKRWYEAHTKPKHQQNKWIPTTELLNGEIIATVLSYPPVPIPRIIK